MSPPTEINHRTRFGQPIVAALIGCVLGAGIAWGAQSANAASMERRLTAAESDAKDTRTKVYALDTRTALLERAVLSLERMAAKAER
jgi:hypothetical protein